MCVLFYAVLLHLNLYNNLQHYYQNTQLYFHHNTLSCCFFTAMPISSSPSLIPVSP